MRLIYFYLIGERLEAMLALGECVEYFDDSDQIYASRTISVFKEFIGVIRPLLRS